MDSSIAIVSSLQKVYDVRSKCYYNDLFPVYTYTSIVTKGLSNVFDSNKKLVIVYDEDVDMFVIEKIHDGKSIVAHDEDCINVSVYSFVYNHVINTKTDKGYVLSYDFQIASIKSCNEDFTFDKSKKYRLFIKGSRTVDVDINTKTILNNDKFFTIKNIFKNSIIMHDNRDSVAEFLFNNLHIKYINNDRKHNIIMAALALYYGESSNLVSKIGYSGKSFDFLKYYMKRYVSDSKVSLISGVENLYEDSCFLDSKLKSEI